MSEVCVNQKELAARWKISHRTLERWRWVQEGPRYLKIGGRVVYTEGRFPGVSREAVHAAIAEALSRPDTPDEAAMRHLARGLSDPVRRFYLDWDRP